MQHNEYARQMRALLSPAEARLLARLSTPHKIQDYLDTLKINFETTGETLMSPRRVIKTKQAHCIEAALLAAASLAYHGKPAYLIDFQTLECDEDHVVAVFQQEGLWGAISKTNHAILRWRDPLYRSVRELAMSYYHEYYMHDGRKTLTAYSKPFDMRRYPPERWLTVEEEMEWLADELDESPHEPVASRPLLRKARRASPVEIRLLDLVEERSPKKTAKKKS